MFFDYFMFLFEFSKSFIMKKYLLIIILIVFPGLLTAQGVLTLKQCREMALVHSQKVQIAKEGIAKAQYLRKAAFTQFLPEFSFSGAYAYMNKEMGLLNQDQYLPVVPYSAINSDGTLDPSKLGPEDIVINPSTGQPVLDANGNLVFQHYSYIPADAFNLDLRNVWLFNAGVSQPIFTGGKIYNLYKSAGINQRMAEGQLRMEQDAVIYDAEDLYWKFVSVREKVRLAESYKRLLDTLVRDLQNLYDEGIVISNDLLRARVKQDEAQLMLMGANDGFVLSRMALCSAIGLPVDSLIYPSDSLMLTEPLPQVHQGDFIGLRPELGILRNASGLAQTGVNIMKSRFLPDIGLTANYTFGNPNPFNGFEKEFGGIWNVELVCKIPLFHFGERFHTLNAARSEQRVADLKLREAEEQIGLQVRQARFRYDESVLRREQSRRMVEQAEENLRVTNDHFSEGLNKAWDVMEAQSLWQQATTAHLEAMTECRLADVWLQKVTGTLSEK